ncbi:hypothetical protein [Nocardia thraciensis]
MLALFRSASRRTGLDSFPIIRLSGELPREWCDRVPGVDVAVAGGADHEGFAPPVGHCCIPLGLKRSGYSSVCEFADVVDFDAAHYAAEFAGVRQEPSEDLLVRVVDPDRRRIGDSRRFLPVQRNVTEPCDQWFPAVAFDACFEAGARANAVPVRVEPLIFDPSGEAAVIFVVWNSASTATSGSPIEPSVLSLTSVRLSLMSCILSLRWLAGTMSRPVCLVRAPEGRVAPWFGSVLLG